MASTGKMVSKNVAVLFARQIVTWMSTILLMLFLPKRLGPINYGKFYLGQMIVGIFSLLIEFGGHYSITKAVSRDRENVGHIIVDSLAIRSLLWLVSFFAVNIYGFLVGYDTTTKIIIFIFSVGMTWTGARIVFWCSYQGFEMMKYPAYSTIAESVFISLVGVTALLYGVGPIGFTIITVLGTLLNLIVCVKFSHYLTRYFPRVNWSASLALLKDGFPYFLNSVFSTIYYRIDTVMLSLMTPAITVGWYGASYRFFDSLMFIPSIFTISIFPALSRMWGENKMSIGRSVQKSLDFVLILGIPISIGIFSFSKEIIQIFYGLQGYQQSVLLLKIFAVGMLLVYVDIMLGTALLASDKQKQLSILAFCAIFVNVGINYILIPFTQVHFNNGSIGSAVATIITEFVIMLSMSSMLKATILPDCRIAVQMKALLAGVSMAAFLWITNRMEMYWMIQAAVCPFVYLTAIVLLKIFEPSDIELMKGMIPKRLWFWKKQ
jgi:O-antigen/teichoic acid export membrane protein